MSQTPQAETFKSRTRKFGLHVIKLFQGLPKTDEARTLGEQLLRSEASVGAHDRAVCRARSNAVSKRPTNLSRDLKCWKISGFWIRMLGLDLDESKELPAMFAAVLRDPMNPSVCGGSSVAEHQPSKLVVAGSNPVPRSIAFREWSRVAAR